MKTLYITTALLLCALLASAQSEEDALRFSQLQHYGSARMTAMGGAFGALGESEVSFTSTLDFAKLKSGRFDHDKNTYLVGSLGFVASFTTGNAKWKYINFGLNYTNLNNFNRKGWEGGHISADNSLIDVWKLEADGTARDNLNPFTTSLAYDAYLLKRDPDNENMYVIPGIVLEYDWLYGSLGIALFVVAVLVATGAACLGELRQMPAQLMRPKAPKAGSPSWT